MTYRFFNKDNNSLNITLVSSPVVGEVVSDEDGTYYEIKIIDTDGNVEVESIGEIEEDWGE